MSTDIKATVKMTSTHMEIVASIPEGAQQVEIARELLAAATRKRCYLICNKESDQSNLGGTQILLRKGR